MIKPALFFLAVIGWPFKILLKLLLKLVLVNLYRLYLILKNIFIKIIGPGQKAKLEVIMKFGPLLIFCLIISWVLIDKLRLDKITAEEIGTKSILNIIAVKNEDYSLDEEIVEGPLVAQKNEQLSYLEDEAIQALSPSPIDLSEGLAYITQDESILASPSTPGNLVVTTRTEIIDYAVQNGDTISTIAQRFGISINTILWANNLSYNSLIKPGQTLKILPTTGIIYKVAKGDNLPALAKKYQADINKIIEFNKLASAASIQIGQNLIIPEGIKPATYIPASAPTIKNIFVPPAASSNTKLLWPVGAKYITQYFTWRHSGVDIGAKSGTAIYAAENGKVERAGWTTGYGYNVVINHGNGMKTLYGHASKLYVAAGDSVSRGQVIAAVGSTGWSTGPHLHFEVTISGVRRNPLNYIR